MLTSVIQLIAVFAVPALILKYRENRLARLFGTIGMAYFWGLFVAGAVYIINLCGIDFKLNSDIGEIGSYAAIGIAIPLILFSSNLSEVKKLAKTVLLSFGALIVSVCIVATAAGYLYGRSFAWGRELCAMAAGMYIGGTPNFNAIGVILGVDGEAIALANLSDMIVGSVFYVFILLLAKPILSGILDKKRDRDDGVYMKDEGNVTNLDDINDLRFSLPLLRNICLSFLCALTGALIGLLFWIVNGAKQGSLTDYLVPAVMLTVTALGVALSFNKKVRAVKENGSVGHYLILVFSFALAGSIDFTYIDAGIVRYLVLLTSITLCTFALHVILSRFLHIGADCTIVTMTAGIYSLAFVPAMTKQLKNESLTAPGLICGTIGYATATFIGAAIYLII